MAHRAHFEFELDENLQHPGITIEDRDEGSVRGKKENQEDYLNNNNHLYPPSTSAPIQPSSASSLGSEPSFLEWIIPKNVPLFLAWIPPHLNFKGMRPVIRSSVAAWIGLILVIDSRTEAFLGQASFLILVVAAISPANAPIATTIENTINQLVMVAIAWAYSCLILFFAHLSRTEFKYTLAQFDEISAAPYIAQGLSASAITDAISEDIFHGKYLETGSSVICCVFLGVGGGFLLWLRGRLGPGPILFGIIFSIIMVTINLTIGVLFPYAYYGIGTLFYIPFVCQVAINLITSFVILPETLAHQFSDRLIATLNPLQAIIQQQKEMLHANPRSEEWLKFRSIKASVNASMASLALLGASESNLTREISYARVSGKDLSKVLAQMRILVSRSTGFVSFFEIIEKHLHREFSDSKGGPAMDQLTIHMGHSRPGSADHSPSSSRPPSRPPSPPLGVSRVGAALMHVEAQLESPVHLQPPLSTRENILHSPSPLSLPPFNPDLSPPKSHFSPHPISHSEPHSVSHSASHSAPHSVPHSVPHSNRPSRPSSTASLSTDNLHASANEHESLPTESDHHHSYLNRFHFNHHNSSTGIKRPRSHHQKSQSGNHHHSGSHISLPSLFTDAFHAQSVRPVGLMESQRYADLEDFLSNPRDEEHLEEIISLLSTASSELLDGLDKAAGHLISTIHRLKSAEKTWKNFFFGEDEAEHSAFVAESEKIIAEVEAALESYRDVKRLDVLKPFASLFDPMAAKDRLAYQSPSHRGLFWGMSYQFSLNGWAEALISVLKETATIEKKRIRPRFWTPTSAKFTFGSNTSTGSLDEERPDSIPGLNAGLFRAARNPDYVPPTTKARMLGISLYNATGFYHSSDFLFGVKAAVCLSLVSLPAFFPQTSYFFYTNRGLWTVIMSALTLTQYLGDTAFGFTLRAVGTFFGALIGLLIWTIATGSGAGNAYALAATCVFFFPVLMFYRVHYSPPPVAILPTVTAMLVIGYSWQDAHQPALSSVGFGWDVAWRRFVCVLIGITAAFVFVLLPPRYTQKASVRLTYAKVISELGGVVCQTLSFANCKGDASKAPKIIVANVGALRAKLSKTIASKNMIRYEASLRGPWPAQNYDSLQTLQMEILDLLGQFLGVVSSLDTQWTKALLHRTQLDNPRFLAEFLTSFQLISSALAHGTPLPMIYNPLLERFLRPTETIAAGHAYGFDVTLGMEQDAELQGIPVHVTLETICSLDYLKFSCGVSLIYAIVNRMDRLMFVTKSLVGEDYIVYGLQGDGGHLFPAPEGLERRWHGDDSRRNSTDSLV